MIDVILILFSLTVILTGFHKGFFYLLFHSLSIFLGIYGALKFNTAMVSILKEYFNTNYIILKILSFLFILLFVVSTFMILHKFICDFLNRKFKYHSLIDRLAGTITGLIVSLIFIYGIYIFTKSNKTVNKIMSESTIISKIKEIERGKLPFRN